MPYVGLGIGVAINDISDANSLQHTPVQEHINHFDSNPEGTDTVFAAEAKAGIRTQITEHLSLFAEYRYLHIASTHYIFGGTLNPDHAITTPWETHFGAMNLSCGMLGLDYSF